MVFGELDPPNDGRVFCWVRQRGARAPVRCLVIRDEAMGPKWEVVTRFVMKPSEYHMTLNELSKLYPPPRVRLDHE